MELDEAVLTLDQRRKRAVRARVNKKKLEIARAKAKRRFASNEILKKRAYREARRKVRKKFAGKRGENYNNLSSAEKIAIDKLVDKKQALIKRLAMRLMPVVRRSEAKRLQSFMRGAPLKSEHSGQNESFENRFSNFLSEEDKKKKERMKPVSGKVKNTIIQFQKFSEEEEANSPTYQSIAKKAEKNDIDIEILGEVYDRGIELWTEDMDVTPQQNAFNRVNSFISGGRAAEEDADLQESVVHRTNLTKHMASLRKAVKGSHFSLLKHARTGEEIKGHHVMTTDASHQQIFDHLKKKGFKKTSGYDPNPNTWTSHTNHDEMRTTTDGVYHQDGTSVHLSQEHGGKTNVIVHNHHLKEDVDLVEAYRGKLTRFRNLAQKTGMKRDNIDKAERIAQDKKDNPHMWTWHKSGAFQVRKEPLEELSQDKLMDYANKVGNKPERSKGFNTALVKLGLGGKPKVPARNVKVHEDHPNCGTPECCGQCEPLEEGKIKDVAYKLDTLSNKKFKETFGKSKDQMRSGLTGKVEQTDKGWKATDADGKVGHFGREFGHFAKKYAAMKEETLDEDTKNKNHEDFVNRVKEITGLEGSGEHSTENYKNAGVTVHNTKFKSAKGDHHLVTTTINHGTGEALHRFYKAGRHDYPSSITQRSKLDEETLDELSKDTLNSYRTSAEFNHIVNKKTDEFDKGKNPKAKDRLRKRETGLALVKKKLGEEKDPAKREDGTNSLVVAYKKDTPGQDCKEETLDEISKKTLDSYISKAGKDRNKLGKKWDKEWEDNARSRPFERPNEKKKRLKTSAEKLKPISDKMNKRRDGIHLAMDKQDGKSKVPATNEEVKSSVRDTVIIPAHKDEHGNDIPAKAVLKRTNRVIVNAKDNPNDGK